MFENYTYILILLIGIKGRNMKNISLSKILTLLVFIGFGIQIQAQDRQSVRVILNQDTINSIADKLSLKEQKQITDFFKLHEEEIKPLTQLKGFVIWKKVFYDNNKNLANAGLKNIEDRNQNYGFQIPDTHFIVEIAGQGNRWQNIVQYFDRMSDNDKYNYAISLGNNVDVNKALLKKMREEIEAEYNNKPVSTYQAISRIYLGNALSKRIQEKQLKNIKQPRRFLVKYPWAPNNAPVNDENYAVIEDHIEGGRHIVDKNYLATLSKDGMKPETIKKHFVDIKEVDPILIPQILEAVKAGLWNFNALLKNGDIYFVNTEQPNSASPAIIEDGFNNKDSFWQNRINGAYKELIGMIKISGTSAQLKAAKKYIESDEETKKLPFYNAIKRAF